MAVKVKQEEEQLIDRIKKEKIEFNPSTDGFPSVKGHADCNKFNIKKEDFDNRTDLSAKNVVNIDSNTKKGCETELLSSSAATSRTSSPTLPRRTSMRKTKPIQEWSTDKKGMKILILLRNQK